MLVIMMALKKKKSAKEFTQTMYDFSILFRNWMK